MAENSAIEWTDHTFNPWWGCQKVSAGCDHCYAETLDRRTGGAHWGPHALRRRTKDWRGPHKWQKNAAHYEVLHGRRQRVFCASMADVFDNQADPEWRADLWSLIRETPGLDWLLLTKRPENIAKMLPRDWCDGWGNVWLGSTCEDQAAFDRRWPVLSAVPARVRFVSYEPAIGPLSIGSARPSWLICGGESGPGARYMQPQWAMDIRAECEAANVPFFMKQMTGKKPVPEELMLRQFPAAEARGELT